LVVFIFKTNLFLFSPHPLTPSPKGRGKDFLFAGVAAESGNPSKKGRIWSREQKINEFASGGKQLFLNGDINSGSAQTRS